MVCKRCIQDESIPGITFDSNGVCNYCFLQDELEKTFPNDLIGKKKLSSLIKKIKTSSNSNEYDCIIAFSGGRDSTYLLYLAKKKWGLNPLAVFFNDGFSNPIAGENIQNAINILDVDLITVTSNWKESKSIRIALLKASVPELMLGTEIGLANALYSIATQKGIKYILNGQSFRTEGIKPLTWSYFDGKYLKNINEKFGTEPLQKWSKTTPTFNLGLKELIFYSLIKRIKVYMPLYYLNYVPENVDQVLEKELKWKNTGFHYFDDLYHSLVRYVQKNKFNIDLNLNSEAALVRSCQINREDALHRLSEKFIIDKQENIRLCIDRLGLTMAEFEEIMTRPKKSFKDYKTYYSILKPFRPLIWLFSRFEFVPRVTYYKYFKFVD